MTKAALLQPFVIRSLSLRNRIVVSPMCQYAAVEGAPQDWHHAHYGRFALGGTGATFVEATAVTRDGRITHGCTGLWEDAQIAPMARIAALLKSQGGAAAIQIGHAGGKASTARPWEGAAPLADPSGDPPWETIGPSAVPIRPSWPAPRPASVAAIEEIIHAFGMAAQRAVKAGFDIVEIHGAHGYLIHSFVSPLTNRRDDAFGGTLEGRMRLPLLVAEEIRRVIPDGMPLFYRASCTDNMPGGIEITDTVALARELKARGVDLIDCSAGGIAAPVSLLQQRFDHGFQVPLAEAVRGGADIPVMAVGLITDPKAANAIVAEGRADLVAIARELIADPNWSYRAALALGDETPEALLPRSYAFYLERRAAAQGR